jgi:thioredoxin
VKNIVEIQSLEQFQQTVAGPTPVLVDLWAPWCGPCRMIAPVLEELATELDGKLVIAKVNVDNLQEIAMDLRVQGIPTLVLFKDGGEADRLVGAAPKPMLRQWLLGRAA